MLLLDGKVVSQSILENLSQKVSEFEMPKSLVVIQVGDNAESNTYIKMKIKFGEKAGIPVHIQKFDEQTSNEALLTAIDYCNQDKTVGGVIVQLPLPDHLDKSALLNHILPEKDVDGLTLINRGKLLNGEKDAKLPATPNGVMKLLDYYKIDLEGKNIVVIGRSQLVGMPLAILLTNKNATVTLAHSKTKNLSDITKQADIVVAAIGKPKMINKSYLKEGAVVVDVGITRVENADGTYSISGDVDFDDVKDMVSAISPVPGGVGPLTVASLFGNLLS